MAGKPARPKTAPRPSECSPRQIEITLETIRRRAEGYRRQIEVLDAGNLDDRPTRARRQHFKGKVRQLEREQATYERWLGKTKGA